MGDITKKTGKSVKQLAIDAARRTAVEPAEILRSAQRQVIGIENEPKPQQAITNKEGESATPPVDEQKLHAQSRRQMQALDAEIQDIRQQQLQKEMSRQRELIPETREEEKEALPVSTKPSRRLMRGLKSQVKKFSGMSKAEHRKPPSG